MTRTTILCSWAIDYLRWTGDAEPGASPFWRCPCWTPHRRTSQGALLV